MSNSITLLVSSGSGPAECHQAIGHILNRLRHEAQEKGLEVDIAIEAARNGPKSAIVRLHGPAARALAGQWTGSVKWSCKSSLRPGHKRQNWFAGVFELQEPPSNTTLKPGEVKFETFRAGGPGGQHQNTTDSAVRATCTSTGVSVISRDGRSQHRNKAIALERLKALLATQDSLREADHRQRINMLHHQLERGNPVRHFKGSAFRETK